MVDVVGTGTTQGLVVVVVVVGKIVVVVVTGFNVKPETNAENENPL